MKKLIPYLIFSLVWLHSLPMLANLQQAPSLAEEAPVGLSQPLGLAVLDLEANQADPALTAALGDLLRLQLYAMPGIRMIERVRMTDVLKEQNFQLSPHCGDSYTCLKEAGRILGVNRLVIGTVNRVGSLYSIHLRLVDVQTAELAGVALVQCACGPEEILTRTSLELSHQLALALYSKMPTGSLLIDSQPSGAEVILKDKKLGVTPLKLPKVFAGEHEILIRKENYLPISQTVQLLPNTPPQSHRFVLTHGKDVGYLSLNTVPAGAHLKINGQPQGPSPIKRLPLPAGFHQLEVSLPGYKTQTQSLLLEAGQEMPVQTILFSSQQPAKGSVHISGEFKGADVWINQKKVGKVPLSLSLSPGPYQLELKKQGYQTWQENLQIESENTLELRPELQREEPHWGIMIGVFSGLLLVLVGSLLQRGPGQGLQRADMYVTQQ
jgi:hypothetical protein